MNGMVIYARTRTHTSIQNTTGILTSRTFKKTTQTRPESQHNPDEKIRTFITKATTARTFLLCFDVSPFHILNQVIDFHGI
jgi:hypothetical protein